FLQKAILRLDAETNSVSNFHLKFMLEFSGHLGFKPNDRHTGFRFFDLVEGEFTNSDVLHPHCVQDQTLTFFIQLLTAPFSEHHLPKANTTTRKQLLQHLVDFYRLHLEGMKEITSHKVLEEVMA
ncbi:MAG: DNA repair protein RecO C-terminal domain-containing protein, partial [Flavobacteriales bacterium]